MPRTIDQALESRILKLLHSGKNDLEVAKALGTSRDRVWGARIRAGLPANGHTTRSRKVLSRLARELQNRRVDCALKAEAMGWPGKSLAEARVLSALADHGPQTGGALATLLGLKWGRGRTTLPCRLVRMRDEGLLVGGGPQGKAPSHGKDCTWSLAPGVRRQATRDEDDEDSRPGKGGYADKPRTKWRVEL
jgi:hypothetical protein